MPEHALTWGAAPYDVSADAEMMLFANAYNDVTFAPMSRRTHHARPRTSLQKATSFARKCGEK